MDNPQKFLNQIVDVIIDRPLGSAHPRYKELIYPINYGYVPNTLSGDGKEIDAYILGVSTRVKFFKGLCIAYIERKEELDPKLVVAPPGMSFSDSEILEQVNFQEKYFNISVVSGRFK